MLREKVFIFAVCFLGVTSAGATEIYLKNGDKISGVIVGSKGNSLRVQTLASGEIKIDRAFIDRSKTYPEDYQSPKIQQQPKAAGVPATPAVQWKKDLSLGYTQTAGNTKKQLGQFSTLINRKTVANEATMKLDTFYSSAKGKMDGKKFYGLLRYAYGFGESLKWYHFYKIEGEQDYFSDIYYRVTPTTGVGYWFSDTVDLKLMSELGLGYQYTSYRTTSIANKGEVVLVPRIFVDKRLVANLHVTEDLSVYPSLGNINDYRVRSETALVNQINERWSFKISYVDDFNSVPPQGFKKNDSTWVTSLEYHY